MVKFSKFLCTLVISTLVALNGYSSQTPHNNGRKLEKVYALNAALYMPIEDLKTLEQVNHKHAETLLMVKKTPVCMTAKDIDDTFMALKQGLLPNAETLEIGSWDALKYLSSQIKKNRKTYDISNTNIKILNLSFDFKLEGSLDIDRIIKVQAIANFQKISVKKITIPAEHYLHCEQKDSLSSRLLHINLCSIKNCQFIIQSLYIEKTTKD